MLVSPPVVPKPNTLKLSSTMPLQKTSTYEWSGLDLPKLREAVKNATNGRIEIHPDVDELEFLTCKDNTKGGPSKLRLRFKCGDEETEAFVFHIHVATEKLCELVPIELVPTTNEGDFCDYVTSMATALGSEKSIGIQVTMATADTESGQLSFTKTMTQILFTLNLGMTFWW